MSEVKNRFAGPGSKGHVQAGDMHRHHLLEGWYFDGLQGHFLGKLVVYGDLAVVRVGLHSADGVGGGTEGLWPKPLLGGCLPLAMNRT
jgi:hypothetical protein